METHREIIIAFELYGTLLSIESVARKLADHIQEKAHAVTLTATWRKYQLEYISRLNSMGKYEPFPIAMIRSLEHALRETGTILNQASTDKVMSFVHHHLSVYPDVHTMLRKIEKMPNTTPVICSNGTDAMVSASLLNSSLTHFFRHVVTVEEIRRYKPAPEAYELLLRRVKKSKGEIIGDVWLVSENPVDVVGARAVGLQAVWVDRQLGSPFFGWADRLLDGEAGRPTAVVKSLAEVPDVIRRHVGI